MIATSETQALVADISKDDFSGLVSYGIPFPEQFACWAPGVRRSDAFSSLFVDAGIRTTPVSVLERSFSVIPQPETLEQYAQQQGVKLADWLDMLIGTGVQDLTLVLNLFPYYLCITRIDKIIKGLLLSDAPSLSERTQEIVLLVRNIDLLLKSSVLQNAFARRRTGKRFAAVDLRGFVASFDENGASHVRTVRRAAFRSLLNVSEKAVNRSLVRETNSHIGHYELENSHVRTHYDLSDFISRDSVWEYFYGVLSELVGGSESILAVSAGLEHSAVRRIGEQLKSTLDGRSHVRLIDVREPSGVGNFAPSWPRDHDMALVLGDIVNTGSTLAPIIRHLLENNPQNKPVKAFALAKMRNTDNRIEGLELTAGTTIKREYYLKDPDKCPLCQLSQPLICVRTVDDFHQVASQQLTPLDFWEIVHDSKALLKGQPDAQGRPFLFRVETTEVFRRYGHWLRNVVRARFEETWPNVLPDVLCTVAEDTGRAFAELVAAAIGVDQIVAIKRDILHRITPGGEIPSEAVGLFSQKGQQTLVVDDGINYGSTMKQLITACRLMHNMPMGVIIFDCRTDEAGLHGIRKMMGNNEVVALYSWPAPASCL